MQQAHARVQRAIAADHVLCITRHVKNFYVRAKFRNALREFTPVHAGHDHIGEEQIDHAFVRDYDLHRRRTVFGLKHAVALFFQKLPHQIAQVGFVLHYEDGCDSMASATRGR